MAWSIHDSVRFLSPNLSVSQILVLGWLGLGGHWSLVSLVRNTPPSFPSLRERDPAGTIMHHASVPGPCLWSVPAIHPSNVAAPGGTGRTQRAPKMQQTVHCPLSAATLNSSGHSWDIYPHLQLATCKDVIRLQLQLIQVQVLGCTLATAPLPS